VTSRTTSGLEADPRQPCNGRSRPSPCRRDAARTGWQGPDRRTELTWRNSASRVRRQAGRSRSFVLLIILSYREKRNAGLGQDIFISSGSGDRGRGAGETGGSGRGAGASGKSKSGR
jgi:hypothetical protein